MVLVQDVRPDIHPLSFEEKDILLAVLPLMLMTRYYRYVPKLVRRDGVLLARPVKITMS